MRLLENRSLQKELPLFLFALYNEGTYFFCLTNKAKL